MIDLKAFRLKYNLSQTEIAEKARIDKSRLSKYENGKETPRSIENRILAAYPEAKNFIKPEMEDQISQALKPVQDEVQFWKDKYEDVFAMLKETRRQKEELDKLLSALKAISDKMDEQD